MHNYENPPHLSEVNANLEVRRIGKGYSLSQDRLGYSEQKKMKEQLAEERRQLLEQMRKLIISIEKATAMHMKTLIVMADETNTANDLIAAEEIGTRFLSEYGEEPDLNDAVSRELAVVLNRRGKYVDSVNILQKLDRELSDKIQNTPPAESSRRRQLEERRAKNLPFLIQALEVLMEELPSGSAERTGYGQLINSLQSRLPREQK